MLRKLVVVTLLVLTATVSLNAQLRPGTFTTIKTTDTSASSVMVGCAIGATTSCTGTIQAGKAVFTSGIAIDGGTLTTHGIVIPNALPAVTTNALYAQAGGLLWNGSALTTGSGTIGKIPKFTAASALGNSVLTESGGNVASSGGLSDSVGSMATIRAGGIGLASGAQYDTAYWSSATQMARVANGTTGQVYTATTSGAPSWTTLAGSAMTLIGETEGTDASAGATTVTTFAISGLTVKDSLFIVFIGSSTGNTTATPSFYNATDSLKLYSFLASGGNITANQYGAIVATMGVDQSSNLAVYTSGPSSIFAAANAGTGIGIYGGQQQNVTTAWTGSWTLGLRHDGVTAGGTFRYRMAVYKIAGQ